jgi:hypothetical protein
MGTVFAGLIGSIGLALVITAIIGKGRQAPQVIEATAMGLSHLSEAALGYRV